MLKLCIIIVCTWLVLFPPEDTTGSVVFDMAGKMLSDSAVPQSEKKLPTTLDQMIQGVSQMGIELMPAGELEVWDHPRTQFLSLQLPTEEEYLEELGKLEINCSLYGQEQLKAYKDDPADYNPDSAAGRLYEVLTTRCEQFLNDTRVVIQRAISSAFEFSAPQAIDESGREAISWIPRIEQIEVERKKASDGIKTMRRGYEERSKDLSFGLMRSAFIMSEKRRLAMERGLNDSTALTDGRWIPLSFEEVTEGAAQAATTVHPNSAAANKQAFTASPTPSTPKSETRSTKAPPSTKPPHKTTRPTKAAAAVTEQPFEVGTGRLPLDLKIEAEAHEPEDVLMREKRGVWRFMKRVARPIRRHPKKYAKKLAKHIAYTAAGVGVWQGAMALYDQIWPPGPGIEEDIARLLELQGTSEQRTFIEREHFIGLTNLD